MLEVSDISLAYGQHRALTNVALQVNRGEIVVILGANGAGNSSLLKAIAGIVPSLPGKRVVLAGHDLSELPAHAIVEAGLALVPEGRGIFGELTVVENLLLRQQLATSYHSRVPVYESKTGTRGRGGPALPSAVAVSPAERASGAGGADHERG